MSIKFRPAQFGDIPAVASLLAGMSALDQALHADSARQASALKLMLPREDILMWVAEEVLAGEAQIVGFCSVHCVISTQEGGPVGVLQDLAVALDWRQAGIGRQLLEGAEAWARRRGCCYLQGVLAAHDDFAQAFCRHAQWAEVPQQSWRKSLLS